MVQTCAALVGTGRPAQGTQYKVWQGLAGVQLHTDYVMVRVRLLYSYLDGLMAMLCTSSVKVSMLDEA